MVTSDSDSDGEEYIEHRRLPSTYLPNTEEEIKQALSTAPPSVFRLLEWAKPASMLPSTPHIPIWVTSERRKQLETKGKPF